MSSITLESLTNVACIVVLTTGLMNICHPLLWWTLTMDHAACKAKWLSIMWHHFLLLFMIYLSEMMAMQWNSMPTFINTTKCSLLCCPVVPGAWMELCLMVAVLQHIKYRGNCTIRLVPSGQMKGDCHYIVNCTSMMPWTLWSTARIMICKHVHALWFSCNMLCWLVILLCLYTNKWLHLWILIFCPDTACDLIFWRCPTIIVTTCWAVIMNLLLSFLVMSTDV